MLKRNRLGETGDTIIEVLIVLAVLGLAIGISYATANRSLLDVRGAQESAQATSYLQTQIEAFRFWAPSLTLGSLPSTFCIDTTANDSSTAILSGSSCNNYQNSIYTIQISNPNPIIPNEYEFHATWIDVQNPSEQDSATLFYRLDQ